MLRVEPLHGPAAEYLKEVEIQHTPGYKSGLIVYGDCASPGRIVRIKLKYSDPREKFYKTLLEKYKKRFGKPDTWHGDPFHVVVAWKWTFTDEKGNRIGMILQHNTEDSSEKLGNVVKLYMYNLEEEEMECHRSRSNLGHIDAGVYHDDCYLCQLRKAAGMEESAEWGQGNIS